MTRTSLVVPPQHAPKYLYLTDPKNKNRIITIARTVDFPTQEVRYGMAVCQPECAVEYRDGDQFNKKKGRLIAQGRLDNLAVSNTPGKFSDILALGTDRPITTILRRLAGDPRVVISRTAQAALDQHNSKYLTEEEAD